jgi:hydrogenase nickel incorporation protein HypB
MKVQVIENVLRANDELAAINRERFEAAGVFVVDLIGAPGSGKTALIEATLPRWKRGRVGIIAADLATQRDADRVARYSGDVVQINTGKTCHLEANHVHNAMGSLDLPALDLLFIENVGNLICPVGFDLGQHAKVGVFNVCGGDDKAAKHPYIVREAAVIVLTQTDLAPYVNFRREVFLADVEALHPGLEVIELSTTAGTNVDRWITWLEHRQQAARPPASAATA